MSKEIKINRKCFIGLPTCGYGYETSKSCFLAAPADEKYTLIIDTIKDLLEKKQYECHIALKRIDPGNFAFCTKICSKIIQAQFCIVLLDPSNKEDIEFPNPNVHMEYGMMLGQNKHIIPLQHKKHNLSFNIAPLDTIKYDDSNFKTKVQHALENVIKKFSSKKATNSIKIGSEMRYYSIKGYIVADIQNNNFLQLLYQFGQPLGYYLLVDKIKHKYKFLGPFAFEDSRRIIFHTRNLIEIIVASHHSFINNLPDDATEKEFDYLIDDITIDVIIPPYYEKSDILEGLNNICENAKKYNIELFYLADYEEKVEEEYNTISEIPKKNAVNN